MNVNRTRTLKRLHLFPFVFKLSSRGSLRLNGTSVVLEGSAFISKVWRLKASEPEKHGEILCSLFKMDTSNSLTSRLLTTGRDRAMTKVNTRGVHLALNEILKEVA